MSGFEELPFDDEGNAGVVALFFESTIGPGRREKLEVARDITIADLKFTVGQVFGLPSDEFHLVFQGLTLDVDDVLSNYDVTDGETLLLIPVSTAG